MSIILEVDGVKKPSINETKIADWIKNIAANHKKELGDLTYIFCSDERILEINNEYLQHDYYTDIITFDYTEGNTISGDIFISLGTVKSNSEELDTNYNEELHRVIIHGILHLCGFKDETEEEEQQMRSLENEALKAIL